MANIKKFLDHQGLIYFCKKFQDYPDNTILGIVINAIDSVKVNKADYAPVDKTDSMTQPVGKDSDGKLWTTPGERTSLPIKAKDIQTREDGTRLDAELALIWAKLQEIIENGNGTGGNPPESVSVGDIETMFISEIENKLISEVEI